MEKFPASAGRPFDKIAPRCFICTCALHPLQGRSCFCLSPLSLVDPDIRQMARPQTVRAKTPLIPMDRSASQAESVWKTSKIFLVGFLLGETFILLLITTLR
jgi:hypothetical protein